jgi:hypothetical protein
VTADAPVTLVWMAAAAQAPEPEAARALESWARAHGVKLELPRVETPRALPVDTHAADDVERLLDRVHDAIAGRDADAADHALAAAEATLRAHPELPQASWLMAEVERARSTRFRRLPPLDEEAAERAWMRAEALDGGRLPGVGERAATAHPSDATLTLEPAPSGATIWLDGRPTTAPGGALRTRTGLHVVVVTWADVPVWATWAEAPPGSSTLHLAASGPTPCTSSDVAEAHVASGTIDARRVRCGAWVAALPGSKPTSVLVATCEDSRCGALLEWDTPAVANWTWTPPPKDHPGAGWPTWATWGLVGAGAVIATGVVLVASGALQSAPTETRFVSGGVKGQ